MNIGDNVTVEWTWGGHRFQAAGVVVKVNDKTVKVRLTEDAGEHFTSGYIVTTQAHNVRKAGSVREAGGHRVADFNTLDDLIAHARDELGATHASGAEARTKLYFPRGGQYEEATVWRKEGYWHAQGPGSRTGVSKLPSDARSIRTQGGRRAAESRRVEDYEAIDRRDRVIAGPFKSYGDAKDAAGPAGAVRFVPSKRPSASEVTEGSEKSEAELIAQGRCPWATATGMPSTTHCGRKVASGHLYCTRHERDFVELYPHLPLPMASRGKPSKATEAKRSPARAVGGAEEAGKQYAYDQVQSDHFKNWVGDQIFEASKLPADQVLPLETKADAMKVARNMLQQLEWDTRRELRKDEITNLIGEDGDVAEFWEGFREASVASREWLADELLEIKGDMRGEGVGEKKRRSPKAKRSVRRRR